MFQKKTKLPVRASINGVDIRNINHFHDHGDGFMLWEADVYIDNKKIAFFQQDSWGGPDRLEFLPGFKMNDSEEQIQQVKKEQDKNQKTLKERSDNYFSKHPQKIKMLDQIIEMESPSDFLYRVYTLNNWLKVAKKHAKNDKEVIITFPDNDGIPLNNERFYSIDTKSISNKETFENLLQHLAEKEKIDRDKTVVLSSPEDFKVNTTSEPDHGCIDR